MTPDQIEQLAREAGIEEMFMLDRQWQGLARFAELVARAERERIAQMLDAEHETRKHLDNHAAFYARMIREQKGQG